MNPLDPATVRRLGDQRRRRQNTMYGVIAAVVVTAAVIPTALIATKGDGKASPPPFTHSTSPDPTPTTVPEPTPTTITFPGNGVEVTTASDVDKLTGTSDAFKAFIAETLAKAVQDSSSCPDAAHGVDVEKYDSSGFALGGVNTCGGYAALWTIQDGTWKEALGTQDEWICGDLTRFSVPDGFAGECYGPKELFGPDEDGGLRLGMSADEVRAAGGTVTPGTGCSEVAPKGITSPDKSPLGYLSPTAGKGVVALFAQHDQVTPRGIGRSSTFTDAKKAYPEGHLRTQDGSWTVEISPGVELRFSPAGDGGDRVTSVALVDVSQDCFEDSHP